MGGVMRAALIACAASAFAGTAAAGPVVPITVDFSFEDDGVTPLVNGQSVQSPDEFGTLFTLSATGSNLGAAIFDSDPAGPNAGGDDADLLVGLGNLLILQSNAEPAQSVPGIFDTPNDSAAGGSLIFDFVLPSALSSVTLVDIDGGGINVTLTDSNGLVRVYDVPAGWTKDIADEGPDGFDVLDLTTLAAQLGEGGEEATATEDAGFNAATVVSLEVEFLGSGGLDNLVFVPTPGGAALASIAMLAGLRRRRTV